MAENWTLARIQQMIADGIEEGRTLDYKAADALKKTDGKKNEISKDVSAFANAGGGTIIYGVKEFDAPSKRHLPERIDPINRSDISKEWLEQITNTKVQPRLQGVEIHPVEVSKTDNTVIYVVEIPQSTTAHQAAGHKYYKRYNFESVPMEDYEIRDIMNRRIHPDLELQFEIEQRLEGKVFMEEADGSKVPIKKGINTYLKIRIINKGNVYAKYINYIITINKSFLHPSENKKLKIIERKPSGAEYIEYYSENLVRDVVGHYIDGAPKYGPSRFDPVLPKMHSRSEEIQLADGPLFSFKDEPISWTIYADNAPPMTGSIKTRDIKNFSK